MPRVQTGHASVERQAELSAAQCVAPRVLAVDAGDVWVVSSGSGLLSKLDVATGEVTVVRHGLGDPLALVIEDRRAWITSDGDLLRAALA